MQKKQVEMEILNVPVITLLTFLKKIMVTAIIETRGGFFSKTTVDQ